VGNIALEKKAIENCSRISGTTKRYKHYCGTHLMWLSPCKH